jgi:hypothetical protein
VTAGNGKTSNGAPLVYIRDKLEQLTNVIYDYAAG